MKRVVLAAALLSVFSSVLSPVTANALPVGNGWGSKRDAIVNRILKENGWGERSRAILNKIISPERKNLFSYDPDRFKIEKKHFSILWAMGLRYDCRDLDPKEYSGMQWMSCSLTSKW
ncbi:hypothetical protein [Bartonella gliris]|uniref:hypothetical protein n=1 Tax=Bartonella gliris TaxID=3004109 RepID=UPI00295EBA91|nr:hypothetical protein [Bartonella gliris]